MKKYILDFNLFVVTSIIASDNFTSENMPSLRQSQNCSPFFKIIEKLNNGKSDQIDLPSIDVLFRSLSGEKEEHNDRYGCQRKKIDCTRSDHTKLHEILSLIDKKHDLVKKLITIHKELQEKFCRVSSITLCEKGMKHKKFKDDLAYCIKIFDELNRIKEDVDRLKDNQKARDALDCRIEKIHKKIIANFN